MKYSEYQPRPDLLKDRIILITGAGDGIGRAAALLCPTRRNCGAAWAYLK